MAYLQVKVRYSIRITKGEIKVSLHELNGKQEEYIANRQGYARDTWNRESIPKEKTRFSA